MKKGWKRRLLQVSVVSLGLSTAGLFALYPIYKQIEKETLEVLEAHQYLESIHPGWSFPGKIYSAPAPLSLPKNRRIAHAKARGYTPACPAKNAGEYCKDGTVIPRGGLFVEGEQPAGMEGWTRALAMEPIFLGPLIGTDAEIREHLPLAEAPDHLIAALLHSEDASFYEHSGVNFLAFFRAVIANLQGGTYSQGASTITMQVSRNMTQEKKKTIKRKLKEIVQAMVLDANLSKDEILQMYLDMPYLGQEGSFAICGFASGSKFYFDKDIRDISIDEAALLVGILPAPAKFRPDKKPALAEEKRNRVLLLMKAQGWDIGRSLQAPISIRAHSQLAMFKHPAFVQATISWLEQRIPAKTLYGSGLQVFTSMDLIVQQETERVIDKKLRFYEKMLGLQKDPPLQAAGVLINPNTGYLEGVYGGTISSPYDFSRATQAKRQAGSSFKPLVYALAFSQTDRDGEPKWKAFDTVGNKRKTFKNTDGWRPRNNGSQYTDTSTLALGLTWSQNIATANVLEEVGGPKVLIKFAKDVGFDTSTFPEEMGIALGQAEITPLEMGQFVATLANGGTKAKGIPVLAAYDKRGRNHIQETALGDRVLSEETAALTRGLMKLVILYGTGGASRSALGEAGYTGLAFGKTGTTDKNKDLWFVGSTPTYSAALWIGYDKPYNLQASSSDLAAPLWGWWMNAVHKDLPEEKEFQGMKLKTKYLCGVSGGYSNGTCKTLPIPILPGQKSKKQCPVEHVEEEKKEYKNVWKRLQEK